MQFSHFIGVDISKSTLDAANYASEMKKADTKHLTNDADGLKELLAWAKANGAMPKSMLICAEHTGVYGNLLQFVNTADYMADMVFWDKKGKRFHRHTQFQRCRPRGVSGPGFPAGE